MLLYLLRCRGVHALRVVSCSCDCFFLRSFIRSSLFARDGLLNQCGCWLMFVRACMRRARLRRSGRSCIDGRLTSAWNWCSQLQTKHFYPIFKLAGFTSFDGTEFQE